MLPNQQERSLVSGYSLRKYFIDHLILPPEIKDKNNVFTIDLVNQHAKIHSIFGTLSDPTSNPGTYHRCKPPVLLDFYHA